MSNEKLTLEQWHKKQAIDLFNNTWEYIDNQNRTHEDDMKMLHMAHASRFHWGEIGEPVNLVRGEWLISRVYCLLGRGDSALFHGQDGLDICLKQEIGDYDLCWLYEAVARAYAVLGDRANADAFKKKASDISGVFTDPDDLKYLNEELSTI